MNAETVEQLRDLAAGDSYAAFKSAALAVGMTETEAGLVWRYDGTPPCGVEADVRDAGMELHGEGKREWLTSTESVELEEWE